MATTALYSRFELWHLLEWAQTVELAWWHHLWKQLLLSAALPRRAISRQTGTKLLSFCWRNVRKKDICFNNLNVETFFMLMLVIISWSLSFSYWIWAHDLHILSTHFSRLIAASIVDTLSSIHLFSHISLALSSEFTYHFTISRTGIPVNTKIANLVKLTWDC